MPSVGSTPTTTSPAPQQTPHQPSFSSSVAAAASTSSSSSAVVSVAAAAASAHHHHAQTAQKSKGSHRKLQQQNSLPLQLQYQHHQPQVTTTQPSPAGIFNGGQPTSIISTATTAGNGSRRPRHHSNDDLSPLSSSSPTNSFSSVDTNQTLLNNINAARAAGNASSQRAQRASQSSSNRSYRTKYGQFMIITPAVSIDRDFERETLAGGTANDGSHEPPYFNGNRQNSPDSGNTSSDSASPSSSFRSNYNPYVHNSRQRLLPKSSAAPPQRHTFYTFSSWRWCTLICAAMRCFGGGHQSSAAGTYSSSFARRPPYQRSRSSGANQTASKTPHRRLRPSSSFTAETAFEHFSAPFTPRKTRDHMNNIMYEL